MSLTYAPHIFHCMDEHDAKAIILTPEAGMTTAERWQRETEWLMPYLNFPPGLVVDYGCGLGRIAKELMGNPVLGVDISPSMRQQSAQYVGRDDFAAVSPTMFGMLIANGLRASGGLCVWALQHVPDPQTVVAMLGAALKPGAILYTMERSERVVPVVTSEGKFGWAQDQHNVGDYLRGYFSLVSTEAVPDTLCHPGAHFARWRRHG